MHKFLLPFGILLSLVSGDVDQCSKDDLACQTKGPNLVDEAQYSAYKHKLLTSRQDFAIREILDKIDAIKSEDPMTAKKLVDKVLKDHPESPRALHSLARIYRILYNKLSPENKSIGREEYLKKLMDVVMKVVKMDSDKVPFALLTAIADFGIANSQAMGEREWTIALANELVEGPRSKEFDAEDQEFHFQTLLDEKFYSGYLEECKEMIIKRTEETMNPTMSMRLLMAILKRIEEKKADEPLMRFNEAMINATLPETREDKDELFIYSKELENELRQMDKIEELNILYDLLVDVKLYPSRYQRAMTQVKGLRAKPVWTLEETEYEDKLTELQDNWEKIRDEALVLMEMTPPQNITMGEKTIERNRKWKQYMFHGYGVASFPPWMCEHTPTICDLIQDYEFATRCPLGTIKLSVIESGAHIEPHVGGQNFKLRAHLPLVVPKLNSTETNQKARMRVGGHHILEWEEGKMLVFDDSFEHEVWNETSGKRVILIIDLIHPDVTQEQFTEISNMFSFKDSGEDSGSLATPKLGGIPLIVS